MTDRAEEFVNLLLGNGQTNELMHYASKYYDPVKAREYYLRTRELKGREATSQEQLSAESRQKQSEATDYVRNQINTQKTAELDANQAAREALAAKKIEQQEAYTARVDEMRAKFSRAREQLAQKLKDRLAEIEEDLKIPENATPQRRLYLQKQRLRQSNAAKAKAQKDLKNLSTQVKSVINKARSDYQTQRTANAAESKSLTEGRYEISTRYANDLKTELENIKNQVR